MWFMAHNEWVARTLKTSPYWKDSGWQLRSHPREKSIPVTHGFFHKKEKTSFVSGSWFPPWNSACRLIKVSLVGKTHSAQTNQYTPLCVLFSSAQEYVFWWSVSLYYEKKWWGVSYYTPMAGMGFLFPWRTPMFCKNTDQEFTVELWRGLYVWQLLSPPLHWFHFKCFSVLPGLPV